VIDDEMTDEQFQRLVERRDATRWRGTKYRVRAMLFQSNGHAIEQRTAEGWMFVERHLDVKTAIDIAKRYDAEWLGAGER
jgi:hypothetical protein